MIEAQRDAMRPVVADYCGWHLERIAVIHGIQLEIESLAEIDVMSRLDQHSRNGNILCAYDAWPRAGNRDDGNWERATRCAR